jgi:hypothetical protein
VADVAAVVARLRDADDDLRAHRRVEFALGARSARLAARLGQSGLGEHGAQQLEVGDALPRAERG